MVPRTDEPQRLIRHHIRGLHHELHRAILPAPKARQPRLQRPLKEADPGVEGLGADRAAEPDRAEVLVVDVARVKQRAHVGHVHHVAVDEAEDAVVGRGRAAGRDVLARGAAGRADFGVGRRGREGAPRVELAGAEHRVRRVHVPAAIFVGCGDVGGRREEAGREGRVALDLEEGEGLELRLDSVRVGRVAALVVAVLGAVLPHPAHVLDRVVGVRDAVVVDLGDAGEECRPCQRHVAVGREVDAGFVRGCGSSAAVIGRGEGGVVECLHDVAEGLDGALEAVVLVEGEGCEEVRRDV